MAMERRAWLAAASVGLAAGFLLCGYEFVRSASNTLFKKAYSPGALPVVMAITPLAVLAMLWIYGRLLSWVGPRKTLLWTTLGSGAGLVLCVGLIRYAQPAIARPAAGLLYVLREAYVVLLIEQYWSLINSTLRADEARRLNGPITGVGSAGAILGGLLVGSLAQPLGTLAMPLFAAAFLLPAAICSDFAYARLGEPQPTLQEMPHAGGTLGLREFLRSHLLVYLLLVIMATQVLSTMLDLNFQTVLETDIPNADRQTAFSGHFFAMLNAVAALLQFVAAPLLLRWLPLRIVHLGIPSIHMAACLVLWKSPTLAAAGAAYMLFKALDYSIFRAGKEILYIPLSFDSRYRAKEVIDVFGYRLGKGGSSLFFKFGSAAHIFTTSSLALIGLAAAGAWALLALPMTRAFERACPDQAPPQE